MKIPNRVNFEAKKFDRLLNRFISLNRDKCSKEQIITSLIYELIETYSFIIPSPVKKNNMSNGKIIYYTDNRFLYEKLHEEENSRLVMAIGINVKDLYKDFFIFVRRELYNNNKQKTITYFRNLELSLEGLIRQDSEWDHTRYG